MVKENQSREDYVQTPNFFAPQTTNITTIFHNIAVIINLSPSITI
jgi:hypothetical protein